MNVDFPFHFDAQGQTATTTEEDHIRDLVEQVLFTVPGERANRPDFGCGLLQLAFAPNSNELAATTQFLVQGALHQWLGNLIRVETVEVTAVEATLTVRVSYTILKNQKRQVATFSTEGQSV
jgi:hypothetical protein